MSRLLSRFFLLGLVASVLLVGAKATPVRGQAQGTTFVGQIEGTDAFVAVVTDGDNVTTYACDGANNGIKDNFNGAAHNATNGALTLTTDDSSDLLTLNADATSLPGIVSSGGSLTGTLQTSDGLSHAWSADPATGPGALYHADDTVADGNQGEGWWIVLNNGDVRGQWGLRGLQQFNSFFPPTTIGMSVARGRGTAALTGLQFSPFAPMTAQNLLTGLSTARFPTRQIFNVAPIPRMVLIFIMRTGTVPRPMAQFFPGLPIATTFPQQFQTFFPSTTGGFNNFPPTTGGFQGFSNFPTTGAPPNFNFPSFPIGVDPLTFPIGF